MSGLKARFHQASLNPSHPCRRGPNTENFFLRNSTNNESWVRENEINFVKLYFCPAPFLFIILYEYLDYVAQSMKLIQD